MAHKVNVLTSEELLDIGANSILCFCSSLWHIQEIRVYKDNIKRCELCKHSTNVSYHITHNK